MKTLMKRLTSLPQPLQRVSGSRLFSFILLRMPVSELSRPSLELTGIWWKNQHTRIWTDCIGLC